MQINGPGGATHCFIIAEAGINHNGSIEIARRLVDVAMEAGADAVKFQSFKADKLVIPMATKARYQVENTGTDEPQMEMLRGLELSKEAHEELFSYCKKRGIIFISTPFDEESADMLDSLGMGLFKIPSGEITNKPLIQHIATKGRPIILSTGMSYLGEVEKAIIWINEIWQGLNNKPQLTLLHCVSDYPALVEDSNLLAMRAMEGAFHLPTGYSDHAQGVEIAIAAVAMGARVVEKHFTLDRNMRGPDHKASLEPGELKAMVKAIRNVEKAIGDGIKRPTEREEEMKRIARRSLVTRRTIKENEKIALEDIVIRRPGTGISPEFRDRVAGLEARRNINVNSVLMWEDLKDA